MTPENFCYWLQGLLEMQPNLDSLSKAQVQMIRDHLNLVFTDGKKPKKKSSAEEDNFCTSVDFPKSILEKFDGYRKSPFDLGGTKVIC